MALAATRPEAGEKLAFLEDRLNEEEGKDFPRAIPKEASEKKREGHLCQRANKIFQRAEILLPEERIFYSKFW